MTKTVSQMSAEMLHADKVEVRGQVRIPLRVLGPPACPHLLRTGPALREMICKEASRQTGFEIHTHGLLCRYDCANTGGPRAPEHLRDRGAFLSFMLSDHYNGWNGLHGVDKYVRKLASNPRFFVPPEKTRVLEAVKEVLSLDNTVTVAMVGSLIISTVDRPLKDWDLMLVVSDYEKYWDRRTEIQAMLPRQVDDMKVDWFVGESMSGSLGAVDILTDELHLSYDFEHSVDESISDVVFHDMIGKWPERFQQLIEDASKRESSHKNSSNAAQEWRDGKSFWEKAESFSRALISGRGTSREVYSERFVGCHGETPEGEKIGKPCLMRRESKRHGGYYCGACGCGDKKLANLSPDEKTGKSKLQFVDLTCPLKKKGFSNADTA